MPLVEARELVKGLTVQHEAKASLSWRPWTENLYHSVGTFAVQQWSWTASNKSAAPVDALENFAKVVLSVSCKQKVFDGASVRLAQTSQYLSSFSWELLYSEPCWLCCFIFF